MQQKTLLHSSMKCLLLSKLPHPTFQLQIRSVSLESHTFTHLSVILMSCHPAWGWGKRHPQSLHRRQGSRRWTQSIRHNKRQHWCLLFLNIWRCWPFISCFLGANISLQVTGSGSHGAKHWGTSEKEKTGFRHQKRRKWGMIYSILSSFVMKTFRTELHKIYNVILNKYDALHLLTGTVACIDPNR